MEKNKNYHVEIISNGKIILEVIIYGPLREVDKKCQGIIEPGVKYNRAHICADCKNIFTCHSDIYSANSLKKTIVRTGYRITFEDKTESLCVKKCDGFQPEPERTAQTTLERHNVIKNLWLQHYGVETQEEVGDRFVEKASKGEISKRVLKAHKKIK